MNLGVTLLACALSAGVGILLYDTFRGDLPGVTREFSTSERGTPSEREQKAKARGARFDEASLRTIELCMDEIERRENEKSQREGIRAAFERTLGSGVSEALFEALADQVLLYRRRAQDIKAGEWSPDEDGGTALRRSLLGLREEYAAVILNFVPAEDVETILQGRLTRFMGLPELSPAEDEK